jgi:transcription elongation factor/antiterminator RfaH
MSLYWYAIYTKHQHEKSAAEHLTRRGFEILLPLYRSVRRWKDRRKIVQLPLFPCYEFVRMDMGQKIEILKTPGVFWLVEQGGRPCAVPEGDMEAIRKLMAQSVSAEPHPFLKTGDLVRVLVGPLAGIQGILVRMKNRYRVVLSVDLLQKSVAAEVDLSEVERVNVRSVGAAT